MKSRVFLSFMAAWGMAAAFAGSAAAVDTIRPEDEALIEGVFADGQSLKAAEKQVVETPQEVRGATKVSVQVQAPADAEVPEVSAADKPSPRSLQYPLPAEREAIRQDETVWFDAAEGEKMRAAEVPAEDGESLKTYRDEIAKCLDNKAVRLDVEKGVLYQTNTYDAAAYLSRTFEEINGCYEEIGYSIINDYYGGDMALADAFRAKADSFYVRGADPAFNPAFCGDNCSLKAVAAAQMAKFAEFRAYLAELLVNRPKGL